MKYGDHLIQTSLFASPSGLMLVDSDMKILDCNQQAAITFGYTATELLGQNLEVLLPHRIRAEHPGFVKRFTEQRASRVLQSGKDLKLFEALKKDGTAAFIQLGITLLQGSDGQIRYVVAISDSTELLRVNTELNKVNSELIESNRQLTERIAEIEILKRNQNHLLHVISHELKSPLHVTTSLLELLNDSQTSTRERAEFSQELSSQINYVVTSIRLLIDYADIQEQRFGLTSEPIKVKQWLRSAIDMALSTFSETRTSVNLNCQCAESTFIMADRLRLQSILVGLVANALKHAQASQIEVYASLDQTGHSPVLHLLVSDNGKGICKDILDRMFEPLANIDQRQALAAGGLGIGLSMYHAYIDSMGGSITVKSATDGQGTQFGLKIPVRMYAADFANIRPTIEQQEKPLYGIHILLCDDDKMIRKVVGLRLNRLGAQVMTASNGLEALKIAQSELEFPIDCILMDLDMPIMNGYDATRQIRMVKGYENIPIFAITAAVESDAFPKAMEAGMDGCYSKPFDPALLSSVLTDRQN